STAGKYMSGSAVGFCGSARYFVSPTVPTMVSQGFVEESWPSLMRLPTGFWFGQKRRATLSLTMTMEVSVASASTHARPAVSGIRSVSHKVRTPTRVERNPQRLEQRRADAMRVRARQRLGIGRVVAFGAVEHGATTKLERH